MILQKQETSSIFARKNQFLSPILQLRRVNREVVRSMHITPILSIDDRSNPCPEARRSASQWPLAVMRFCICIVRFSRFFFHFPIIIQSTSVHTRSYHEGIINGNSRHQILPRVHKDKSGQRRGIEPGSATFPVQCVANLPLPMQNDGTSIDYSRQ